MTNPVKCDGSYPFDKRSEWVHIKELDQLTAQNLTGGNVCNKEFVVIARDEDDPEYRDWVKNGREHKVFCNKKYFPGALAVYRHDFKWWLIQHT